MTATPDMMAMAATPQIYHKKNRTLTGGVGINFDDFSGINTMDVG